MPGNEYHIELTIPVDAAPALLRVLEELRYPDDDGLTEMDILECWGRERFREAEKFLDRLRQELEGVEP